MPLLSFQKYSQLSSQITFNLLVYQLNSLPILAKMVKKIIEALVTEAARLLVISIAKMHFIRIISFFSPLFKQNLISLKSNYSMC